MGGSWQRIVDDAVRADLRTFGGLVLEGGTPRLVNEWQLAPLLWNAARHTIDERGTPGQFIFAGSATPSDDHTRHSGAGRFGRLLVRPMSLSESRESTGHVDAIVELRDGTWSAFEVKMGGSQAIEQAASNLKKLKAKVASNRQRELGSLTVLTAGNTSYAREDGVNVVSLGHLTA